MYKRLKAFIIRFLALILAFFIGIYRKFNSIPRRIYFCYNQSIHQIYHSIFVAIELSNLQKEYEVMVFSTSLEASSIIESELSLIPNNVKFVKIYHPRYSKTDFNVNWFVFLCRLRMHKPLAVVVTDYYDNVFRKLLLKTFWIYIPHGIANRQFAFEEHVRDYDLVFLPGERDSEAFLKLLGGLKKVEVLGYSKFDYFHYHSIRPRILFKDVKPVILYNPHFEKSLSSFYDQGIELLRVLSCDGRYNVIFMPHPDLTRKHPRLIDEARAIASVAVINRPKINLEYMATSDIYITDVSSSALEWLYFDKPTIFFNTKKVDWRQNPYYASWFCGEVVENLPQMMTAVESALKDPQKFAAERKALFDRTFLNRDRIVSKDIARSIIERMAV